MVVRVGKQEFAEVVEVLPGRLSWASLAPSARPAPAGALAGGGEHYFSVDDELVYEPFSADFGPLNLGMTYRFCKMMEAKMSSPELAGRHIVHYCSGNPQKRANAAYLICAYQVLMLQTSPQAAWKPFTGIRPQLMPFRDALSGPCSFGVTVPDCLEGLAKAVELGWFSMNNFDLATYERLLSVDNIDGTWVLPKKFFAFAGPSPTSRDAHGFPCYTPEDCSSLFRSIKVGLVVRLNRKQYERRRFLDQGIKHLDLYFPDGSCPSQEIISRFLWVAEHEPGAVAVHCKAGLGRTCTLIGLYAMKHYHFPARALIGWFRIARPGSVLGPQQQFMVEMQDEMFEAAPARQPQLTPPVPAPVPAGFHAAGPSKQQQQQQQPAEQQTSPQQQLRPATTQVLASSLAPQHQQPMSPQVLASAKRAGSAKLAGRAWAEQYTDVGQGERLTGARRAALRSSHGGSSPGGSASPSSGGGSSPGGSASPPGAAAAAAAVGRFGGGFAAATSMAATTPAVSSPSAAAARGLGQGLSYGHGGHGWSAPFAVSTAPFAQSTAGLPRLHSKQSPLGRQGSVPSFVVGGVGGAGAKVRLQEQGHQPQHQHQHHFQHQRPAFGCVLQASPGGAGGPGGAGAGARSLSQPRLLLSAGAGAAGSAA